MSVDIDFIKKYVIKHENTQQFQQEVVISSAIQRIYFCFGVYPFTKILFFFLLNDVTLRAFNNIVF